MIKTEEDLEKEWGHERFVNGLGYLSNWYVKNGGIPKTLKEMQSLARENKDAFDIFVSRLVYKI